MKIEFFGHGKSSGIYKIANKVSGKVYIGSCENFKKRASVHSHSLKNNKHHNKHLQSAYNKYGTENFLFQVVEITVSSLQVRREREQEIIEEYLSDWDSCYNISKTTIKNQGPWSASPEESKEKISKKSKEMWESEKHRKKMEQILKVNAIKQWKNPEIRFRMEKAISAQKNTTDSKEK